MQRLILVVDDNEVNRRLLRRILSDEYEVVEARDGQEAITIIRSSYRELSAVLLDLVMPVMDGYEVLAQVRIDPLLSQIPVIVATGNASGEAELDSLSMGANDFIVKPYNANIIKKRLQNIINLRETSAAINALQKDELTGLYNSRTFFEKAADLIASQREGYYVISCLDVNNFKVINDQYGNPKGDMVLKQIADILQSGFSALGGLCCRVMADTFAIIYPCHYQNSSQIADIRQTVSKLDGSIPPLTFSIGEYVVTDLSLPVSTMYGRAVMAEVTAKGRYDVSVAVYDESMRQALLKQQEIVTDMNMALTNHEYEVWFQPQYNHSTGALIGAEALVRWRHPKKGLIPPNVFIPVFERNGFIYELDKYVWEEVCYVLRRWLNEGRSPLPVSVNLSRYDIFRDDLISVLRGLLRKYELPVELLRLEITESAFATSTDQIIQVVKQLIELGFTVEIDDFGSGYSSLNTLKDVPASILKLDMRFFSRSDNNERGGNIVEAVVRMAKWLGMSVIAEGVETIEQADYLKSIGCVYVQGYLYAKPIPVKEYESLARQITKEEKLLALETVQNLDNNAFWDPASMDSLIFNSYVGAACIFEYHEGRIELLRATDKYTQMLGNAGMSVQQALELDWNEHLNEASRQAVAEAIKRSLETKDEVTGDFVFYDLPGCPHETYLRSTLRVIATTGDRCLLYCTNENLTKQIAAEKQQQEAERKERSIADQLRVIMENINGGVCAFVVEDDGTFGTVFSNDRYYQIIGYTREQFNECFHSAMAPIHPDDAAWVTQAAKRSYESRKSTVLEYRILSGKGDVIWVRQHITNTELPGINDRLAQLSVFYDITTEKVAAEKIKSSDEQLRFLNAISSTLLSNNDTDDAINSVLQKTLDYFNADRAYVLETHADGTFSNTYEVCAPQAQSRRAELQNVKADAFAYWWKTIQAKGSVAVQSADAPNSKLAKAQEQLTALGLRSRVAVPLMRDGRLIGAIGVDNPNRRVDDVEHLRAIGDYTAVILTRRDLNARIENDSKNILALMQDTPGGFVRIMLTPEKIGVPIYVNDGFCELLGMTRDEVDAIYQGDASKGVHPDDVPALRESILNAMRGDGHMVLKHRLLGKGGNYQWVQVFGRVSRDDGGQTYLNAYYSDLSAKETHDLTIRETTPFILQAIMSASSDLSFAKDKDFRYICCSPAFARLVGQETQDDVVGKTDEDLFEPEVAKRFRQDDEKLFASGESLVDYVEEIPSDDDVQHYSSTSKYILRDTAGEIIGLYGTGRDITEYRTAFERLKLLTDNIPGGIASYVVSPEGVRVSFFNDGFCSMLGYTREEYAEISKDSYINFVFDEDRPILDEQIKAVLGGCKDINCIYRIHNRYDSGYKWVNLRGSGAEKRGDSYYVNTLLFDVTERMNAEEALRIHEEEMKLALSRLGRTICEYDLAKRIITVPKSFAKLYGLETVIENVPDAPTLRRRLDKTSIPAYNAFYNAILHGNPTGMAELMVHRPDGSVHWERCEFSSIFDTSGMPAKAIISIDDTTEQHRRFELECNRPTLGEANLLIHALFNLTTGETLEYSYRDGRPVPLKDRTALNSGYENLDNVLVDRRERERYREFNDPAALLKRFQNGETEITFDYRRRMPDGEIMWLRNILHMMREPDGSDVLLFEYCYNIEEEKLLELMYGSLVSESYDYVIRVNSHTKRYVVVANSKIKSSMPSHGSDVNILIRSLTLNNVHPDDQRMVLDNSLLENIKHNLAAHERFQFNCRVVESDGSIHYKRFTQFYLDRQQGIVVVTREDVTQLMRDEAEKNALLASALTSANQANQAKSQFLSRMSHELRTPMNAIIGLAALSASEVDNPKAMEDAIGKIGMSARYLLSLINDILEMSRIESGRMTLSEAPFDFEQFVVEVNNIIYPQTAAKGLDYDVIVNSYTEPSYVGDITKLQEILVNVLGNAVKFTKSGGKVTLAIEQLRCVNQRATMRFVVSDTGVGIDEEYLPHLFEAFSQETVNLTSPSVGTGLGLAITKNLVEMMNGQISVQSIKNVGSVFTIDVQLGITDESRQYMDMVASMSLERLRVLVVDDDVTVCQSTEAILKAMGMQAEWTDSGLRAVERVEIAKKEKSDFDTIFIDWKMPDMDGIETTRRIRKIVGPDVTIIIMTAYDWHSIETEARAAGVDMFMDKPLFQSSIVKAFEKVFRTNQHKIEPPQTPIDFSGKRILLAEDHPLNIEVAKRLLEKVGAEVVVTQNGLEAMETFTTSQDGYFDAILMDIRMPVMDGLTATKNIRNLRKNGSREIPIIAMTANAFDEDVELSLSSGMNAHLAKPIEPKVMYATLKKLMKC